MRADVSVEMRFGDRPAFAPVVSPAHLYFSADIPEGYYETAESLPGQLRDSIMQMMRIVVSGMNYPSSAHVLPPEMWRLWVVHSSVQISYEAAFSKATHEARIECAIGAAR